jgi:ABC-type xylose transport system permease subunit
MARQSFWSGLVVMVFAALCLTWIIPNYAGVNPLAQMPPDLVPNIASWIMLLSAGVVVTKSIFEMVEKRQSPVNTEINWRAFGWAAWPFLYVAAAIYVLMHVKLTYAGAPIIALMLFLLGERRWYILLGCSVVPVVLLYILSVYMMRVGVV